jgi:hypothetical protein
MFGVVALALLIREFSSTFTYRTFDDAVAIATANKQTMVTPKLLREQLIEHYQSLKEDEDFILKLINISTSAFEDSVDVAEAIGYNPSQSTLTVDVGCKYLRLNCGRTFATDTEIHELGKLLRLKIEVYGTVSYKPSSSGKQQIVIVAKIGEFGLLNVDNPRDIVRMHSCNCGKPHQHYQLTDESALNRDTTCDHFNLIRNNQVVIDNSKAISLNELNTSLVEFKKSCEKQTTRVYEAAEKKWDNFMAKNCINFSKK